jgi:hypothetical protein
VKKHITNGLPGTGCPLSISTQKSRHSRLWHIHTGIIAEDIACESLSSAVLLTLNYVFNKVVEQVYSF